MGRRPVTPRTFNPDKMGENPFLRDYTLKVMEMNVSKELSSVKRSEGIITDITATGNINNKYYVEITPYNRFYKIRAHLKELLQLSGSTLKLLVWIMQKIENGKDYIVINISEFKQQSSVSHSSYCKAIRELSEIYLIMKSTRTNVFWINPAYFFPGNAILKYPDNLQVVAVNTEEIREKLLNDELK